MGLTLSLPLPRLVPSPILLVGFPPLSVSPLLYFHVFCFLWFMNIPTIPFIFPLVDLLKIRPYIIYLLPLLSTKQKERPLFICYQALPLLKEGMLE